MLRPWLWRLIGIFVAGFTADAVFMFFLIGRTRYDPTPIIFSLASLFLVIVLSRFDFFDTVPYAKNVVLESIETPLLVADATGLIVGANEEARRVLPGEGALEGRFLSEIVPVLAGVSADREAREWRFEGIDYLITCYTVKRGPERRRGRLFIFRDVSAFVKAKRESEEARARADAASAAKSAFIATVSHELRNPLSAIIGLVDLNLRAGLPSQLQDDLEVIQSSGNLLLGLVNDLLDLSKIEAGKMELERIDFDLHEKVMSVLRAFRPAAEKKGLFLDIVIDEGTPRLLKGDPLRYGQVLMNLVSNAVKFTPSGAVIVHISLAEGESQSNEVDPRTLRVVTTVRDTGMGIAPDKLSLLFSDFSQADPSVSRRFGGSGLGLAISKRLVELFGGEIRIRSSEGKGSVFSFTARFEPSEPAQANAERPGESGGADGRKLRVLVVDDDPVNAAVARRYIGRFGHESACAETGAAAIEAVARSRVDLVLVDLGLPDMDGFEACRRIRTETAERLGGEPPIAAMTARAETGLRADCARAGMIDCLAKPLDPSALGRLLASVAAQARDLGPRAASTLREPWADATAAASEPAAPGAPLVDVPALLERLDGDTPFMRELLGLFVEETPGRLEAFGKAARARDVEALQKLSHGLKGSSLSLCAKPLAAAAGVLEAACLAARRAGAVEPAAFLSLEARSDGLGALLAATAAAAESVLARGDGLGSSSAQGGP
jgi:signal transduction histidine kinase/DNA-binding NarL/FixJ family response regulator